MQADSSHSARPKKARLWKDKFREAFRGIKLGIRGHSSFYVHFFAAALVIAMGLALECDWFDWCFLLGSIGIVFTAELFNSALETVFHGLDADTKSRIHGALDIAAGAVLTASMTALAIGAIVFIRRAWIFFR